MIDDRTGGAHSPHSLVEEVLALGEERVGTGPYLYGLGRRGANEWWRGELARAEETLTGALGRARAEGRDQYNALYNEILVRVRADRGDFDGAEEAFREAVDRRWRGVAVVTPLLYQEHGRIHAYQGRFDEAAAEFDHATTLVVDQNAAADGWAYHSVALLFRAVADVPAAVTAVANPPPALRDYYGGRWHSVMTASLGVVALIENDLDGAGAKFEEALEAAQKEQRLLYVPVAQLGLAAVERERGNLSKAGGQCAAALEAFLAMDARPSVVHGLEEAAVISSMADDLLRAVRLFAAADAERGRLGYITGPRAAAALEPFRTAAMAAVDNDESATAEGARMTLEEAVAYARGNRGSRRRPPTGWDSLTPTEVSVVRLVRDGLSNATVAERLFISPRTVATHLGHVYAKLGISTRTELTARAVERGV
jgi:DNA-binding CsgD family transcriptional regulator/predicted negative regulator of RcsB-dependent stress response